MSQSPPLSLPLIATPENRGESTSTDAKLVNGYVEKTAMGELWCYKRPGCTVSSTVGTAGKSAGGIYAWKGNVYSIFGDEFYKDSTYIGAVNGLEAFGYTFTQTLAATPQLFFKNKSAAYKYDSGGGLAAIASPNYPASTVVGCVYLDGTIYVMTPDCYILGSGINDPATWDPLNVIRAQIEPSSGVAIAKQLSYVVAFKQFTTEVFYDAQNAAGSPLGRVEGAQFNYGCFLGETVVDIDGALYYMGQSLTGEINVMKLENLKHEFVSTPAVERLLKSLFNGSLTRATRLYAGGHKFYVLTNSVNTTLVFDVKEKLWYLWYSAAGSYFPVVSSTKNGFNDPVGQGLTDGKIYTVDAEDHTDTAGNFTWELITPVWDGGSRLGKMVNILEIKADQQSQGDLEIRFSDDDYATWSDWRTVDLSLERPMLAQMGTFKRRAHHFRHTGSEPFRIKAVDLHVDLCTL